MRGTTVVLVAGVIGCVRLGGEIAGSDRDADNVAAAQPAQARTVTTISEVIQTIAVRDDRLFVGTGTCVPNPAAPGQAAPVGRIISVSIDGGAPTTLWTGAENVMALAVRNDDVFALTDAQCMVGHNVSLRRVRASGGGDQAIASWGGGLFCAKLLGRLPV